MIASNKRWIRSIQAYQRSQTQLHSHSIYIHRIAFINFTTRGMIQIQYCCANVPIILYLVFLKTTSRKVLPLLTPLRCTAISSPKFNFTTAMLLHTRMELLHCYNVDEGREALFFSSLSIACSGLIKVIEMSDVWLICFIRQSKFFFKHALFSSELNIKARINYLCKGR